MTDMRQLLLAAFQKHSVAPDLRAGIAALCGGESEFRPRTESSYAHTGAARLREVFPSRLSSLNDGEIDQLKADDRRFFERVYGASASLGNIQQGDGYTFRGRSLIQLTGRANYERYGKLCGVDLVGNPELANDPAIAVEVAVVYMLDRYKGGGWDAMKRAVGNSFGSVDERKNHLFTQYSASGEWNAPAQANDGGSDQPKPDVATTVKALQTQLAAAGSYYGPIDGDPGPLTIQALRDWRAGR